jgi:NAD(P)-dependent dehydrogenase (short-subunit alcohol dehydrogenase family)
MENRESVIFVTGASSGIGNACATFLAKKGTSVYGTCRSPSSYARKADEFFEMILMDLSDASSIAKAADKVFAKEGRVDALVCCAGSGLAGSVEDTTLEEAQELMDVNFFGTLRTIKAFLPRMREAGRGRVIIVGAIEGLIASPFQSAFSAANFALEGLAQSLRMEVSTFGIEVGVIDLASFRTSFGRRRRIAVEAAAEAGPYKKGLENALGVLERDEVDGFDPLVAARAIYGMLTARRMPPRKTAGRPSRRILAAARRWLGTRAIESRLRGYYRLE